MRASGCEAREIAFILAASKGAPAALRLIENSPTTALPRLGSRLIPISVETPVQPLAGQEAGVATVGFCAANR